VVAVPLLRSAFNANFKFRCCSPNKTEIRNGSARSSHWNYAILGFPLVLLFGPACFQFNLLEIYSLVFFELALAVEQSGAHAHAHAPCAGGGGRKASLPVFCLCLPSGIPVDLMILISVGL